MTKHRDGKDAGEIRSITAKRKAATVGEAMDNQDIVECIEAAGFHIKYNEVLAELEVNEEPMNKGIYANIVARMRHVGMTDDVEVLTRERNIQLALDSTTISRKYNPLMDYLDYAHIKFQEEALKRDGDFSPIRELRKAITGKREQEADEGIDWPYDCLKYWLCGAVAKVRCGFQNWMLVLQGPQGTGKSLLSRRLGRAAGAQYFNAGFVDAKNKDHLIKRSTTFVWEAEELDGTMNYSDMALLKAFLTQDSAKERVPYDKYTTNFINRCSFIGTVNTSQFLKDTTGNRRFLCMEVIDMDREAILNMDMDLVWGEASFMLNGEVYNDNGHIELPDELKAIQVRVNEEEREAPPLEDDIGMYLQKKVKGEFVPMVELRNMFCESMGDVHAGRAIATVMRTLGYGKAVKKGQFTRGWYKI